MAFRDLEVVGLRGGDTGDVLVEDTAVMPLNVRASGLSGLPGGVGLVEPLV